MTTTPESRFVRAINKLLPSDIYSEGMANPYRGGTPDRYYEGCRNSIWIEFKYSKDVPATWRISDALSSLQKKWLRRAQKNKTPVAVIAGFNKNGLVFVGEKIWWDTSLHRADIIKLSITKQDIAAFIIMHCGSEKMGMGGDRPPISEYPH